jgi:hypothetical protein
VLQLIGIEIVRRTAMQKAIIDPSSNLCVVICDTAQVWFLIRPQLLTRLSTLPTGKDIPLF